MVLTVLLPIYALVMLGMIAVRARLINGTEINVLSRYAFYFALPALMITAFSAPGSPPLDPRFLLGYGVGSLASLLLAWAIMLWRDQSASRAAMMGLGAACSNSGFIGYPLTMLLLPTLATPVLAHTMLVENLMIIPLSLVLAQGRAGGWRRVLPRIGATLVRNPLILALVLGLTLRNMQVTLPEVIQKLLMLLGQSVAPVALFYVGALLIQIRPTPSMKGQAMALAVAKLILHPLLVALCLTLTGVDGDMWRMGVIFAALPMIAIYPLLAEQVQERDFAATGLLLTMISAAVSLSVVLLIV